MTGLLNNIVCLSVVSRRKEGMVKLMYACMYVRIEENSWGSNLRGIIHENAAHKNLVECKIMGMIACTHERYTVKIDDKLS